MNIEYVDTDSAIMELKVGEGKEYAELFDKILTAYKLFLDDLEIAKEINEYGKRKN